MALLPFRKLRFLTHLFPRDAGNRIKENMDLGERLEMKAPAELGKDTLDELPLIPQIQ